MKVAGYIRISKDREGQKESPENQRQIIEDFIKGNNYDLHDYYTDVQTGTNDKRDGLKKMIEDAENKQFDVIVAKELSRLGRNVELLYQLIRITSTQGVRVITLDGKVDTNDPAKQAMFGLYAWIYESESQRISERIKSVFRVKQKQGFFLGSRPPYGYRLEKGKFFVNEEEAPIVQDIFAKYLSGMSRTSIARYLNEKGIPTRSGYHRGKKCLWAQNTLKAMLSNPCYVGDIAQNRTSTVSVTTKRCRENKREDWIVVENVHEPIITREIFEQASSMIEEQRKRGRGKLKSPVNLFTNLIYCEDCGYAMWYHKSTGGHPRYMCGRYGKYGKAGCTIHSVLEKDLSEAILSDLRKMSELMDSTSFEKKLEKKAESTRKKLIGKLKHIDDQITRQAKLKQHALEKFVCDEISKAEYGSIVTLSQEKIEQLEDEKSKITDGKDIMTGTDLSNLKKRLDKYLKFNELTREMLHWFVERIEVTESRDIKVTYKFAQIENVIAS